MNKIVELLIDIDNLEFNDLGVDIMSLVEDPAIGIMWQTFAAQKFVDVNPGESEDEYIGRCIPILIEEGFDQDQATAICYGSYEDRQFAKEGEISEAHLDYIEELVSREDFGRQFDAKTTSYVDMSKSNFATEEEIIQGIGALNDLLKRGDDDRTTLLYRYNQGRSLPSGSESRRFCRIMMQRASKYYTIEEINQLSNFELQPGMGPNAANYYDVFKYKGGVNCRHRWLAYRQYDSNGRTVVAELGQAPEEAGQIASSSNNWWRMSAEKRFSFNEDQMIVTGPAMIPNMMIPRRDAMGNLFHVYFSEETVRKIAQKFLEQNKQHNTDIDHDDNVTNENTLLESWIVEDPEKDKAAALGFDVPKSTWMTSYKINNKETWQKIKEGKLNGFSIAGQFIENYD